MNLYIYPKYMEDANKSHWTVKLLRVFGVLQIIGCTAIGALYGAALIQTAGLGEDLGVAGALTTILGLLIGLMVGIISSVGTWAVALVIDDIHAMRINSSAYVAFESDSVHLGK